MIALLISAFALGYLAVVVVVWSWCKAAGKDNWRDE